MTILRGARFAYTPFAWAGVAARMKAFHPLFAALTTQLPLPGRQLTAALLLVGGLMLWMVPGPRVAAASQGCGPPGAGNASPLIAHAPTLSLSTVEWELANRHSPLSRDDARSLVAESHRYQIDDAFALAVWASETQDGREAVPGTQNIGNLTAAVGVQAAGQTFAVYPSWRAGIDAWFALIARVYLQGGHATDLVTFALYYVEGLTPPEATPAQAAAVDQGYVHPLTSMLAALDQHEARLPQGADASSSGERTGAEGQRLSSLLPGGMLPSWAGAGVFQAAAALPTDPCAAGASLVRSALRLGAVLRPDASGVFDRWGPGAPAGVRSEAGVVRSADFVALIHHA